MTISAPVRASLMLWIPYQHPFIYTFSFTKDLLVLLETLDGRVGVDVGNVSGNTGSTSDVVEGKASNTRVLLEEERHGLTDTTYSHRNGSRGCTRMD